MKLEKENGIRILKYLNRNEDCMLYVLYLLDGSNKYRERNSSLLLVCRKVCKVFWGVVVVFGVVCIAVTTFYYIASFHCLKAAFNFLAFTV
jgi:hypothetical protein